ncbi:hypothetical protein F4777DRAFT_259119 [Nemania sp. FL0916]|nr:hypothetical protein F4777DRAFT_259119 [Nemania sp. FL0916]
MSTSRALRPLFGAGSRLVADQFSPTSAVITTRTNRLFSSASARRPIQSPIVAVCWNCLRNSAPRRQPLRFSSSASRPPDQDGNGKGENDSRSSNTASSSSARSTATEAHEDPRGAPIDSSGPEQPTSSSTQSSTPNLDTDPDLPSAQNSRRSALNQSLSSFMDRAQTTAFAASQRINDLTGYSSIETLKAQIAGLEAELRAAQTHLTASRAGYKTAVADRAATQREVTTLLARQKTWTPPDFERFTSLYRRDYELEAAVADTAAQLEAAERDAERLARDLAGGILARYHEEQIWSDKIRRMSTWGTWGLMGVNVLLFLLLQFGAEPWRRRRLVRGFEEKVREALAEERLSRAEPDGRETVAIAAAATIPVAEREGLATATERSKEEPVIVMAAPDVPIPEPDILSTPPTMPQPVSESPTSSQIPRITWREALTDPEYWRAALKDLVSDRKITLPMRDISLIAVESAATGVAFAGGIVTIFLLRRS